MSENSNRRLKRSSTADFELRHWRSTSLKPGTQPSPIRIPNGNNSSSEITPTSNGDNEDGGYISLRDILTSPAYADHMSSPVGRGSCPEIHITNPLVKHAAYAYLQPTASAREGTVQRQVGLKRVIREIFSPCLEFLGVIFNFRR